MPKEGCIVAFHPRQRNKPRMWGFSWAKILHLMESGVTYLPEEVVMEMGFNRVSYYD